MLGLQKTHNMIFTHSQSLPLVDEYIRDIPSFDETAAYLWNWVDIVDEYFELVKMELNDQARLVANKFRSYVFYWW